MFTLTFFTASLVAEAQPTGKVYRIGRLTEGVLPVTPLLEALRGLGYVDGHNLVIEQRHAATREQLPALAAELVAQQVDLIVTHGTPATRAAKQATTTVPIVFLLSADPVQTGLVASFARPGGNLTGFCSVTQEDKRLALLKEAVPGVVRVACLCRRNPDPTSPWAQTVAAAPRLGLELVDIAVQGPHDFDHFFAAARHAGADAVLVPDAADFMSHLRHLGELAIQSRLPAVGPRRPFVEAGGLLSYARKEGEHVARAAAQIDKILRGATPADLPVEQPLRFELVVNLKTAKALGLTLSPQFLFQAEEVIQ